MIRPSLRAVVVWLDPFDVLIDQSRQIAVQDVEGIARLELEAEAHHDGLEIVIEETAISASSSEDTTTGS